MAGKLGLVGFLVYAIFGLYFVNSAFAFVTLPDFVVGIDKWLLVIGAGLIFVGGINYLRAGKKNNLGE